MKFFNVRALTRSAVILISSSILFVGCMGYNKTKKESSPKKKMMKMKPPMGSAQDVNESKALWESLTAVRLVGKRARKSRPYKGQHPHGAVLETLHRKITVNGHKGIAIVKRNYGGPGVSNSRVRRNRAKYLKAITVMFKRERGYDSANKDWFYAKYKANGDLHVKQMKNGMQVKLAGRVAKGMPSGCISCHKAAGGGDYVFSTKIRLK